MEEDGTLDILLGTQVIHATQGVPITEDEDPIIDGGHIINGSLCSSLSEIQIWQ